MRIQAAWAEPGGKFGERIRSHGISRASKVRGRQASRFGDGGIDGVAKEDRLRLDVICLLAKRWKNPVRRSHPRFQLQESTEFSTSTLWHCFASSRDR
ncbi:restriction endonuclease [Paraburkholderia sp. BR10936]|uniref:restriction endonuclease n=1 Tax=Paraburkholderia sp. BR10936 TaxID=3236993 RepID=UPI0034D18DE0